MDLREEIQNGQHIANEAVALVKDSIENGFLKSKTAQAAFVEEFEKEYVKLFNKKINE